MDFAFGRERQSTRQLKNSVAVYAVSHYSAVLTLLVGRTLSQGSG
jgi:hypothetical protein